MRSFLFALVGLLAVAQVNAVDYIVRNWCPSPIEWFIGADSQGTLPTGGSAIRLGLSTSAGFFYTTANGGRVNGQLVAARAGFFFEPNYWYYYIVRDPNSNNFNTGISITPSNLPTNGFCITAACKDGNCTTAYRTPPVFNGGPPPPDLPPTDKGAFQCKIPGTNFDITFCPGGNWPQVRGAPLLPFGNTRKCVDVKGNVLANGTPVQVYDCNDTNAQRWFLSFGSTQVRVAGTNFCLDAGTTPADGVPLKIWQCFDNLPAQTWVFSNSNFQLRLANTNFCADLRNGGLTNGNVFQTWTCASGNPNQQFGIPDIL